MTFRSRALPIWKRHRVWRRRNHAISRSSTWLGKDSGPRVLRHLGGRKGKLPAILVTGLDHPAYKRAGLKAGAIQCMSKDMLTGSILQDAIASTLLTHRIETGADESGP